MSIFYGIILDKEDSLWDKQQMKYVHVRLRNESFNSIYKRFIIPSKQTNKKTTVVVYVFSLVVHMTQDLLNVLYYALSTAQIY